MKSRDVMVRDVSRTFALSIEVLPAQLRDAVSVAYLMFRVSDGIEDHHHLPAEQKVDLLHHWARVLDGSENVHTFADRLTHLDGDDPEVDVAQRAGEVLQWLGELPRSYQEPIVYHVHASTLGMARWQAHGPYVSDEAELDDYMFEVAGRVGYLVTDLYALYAPILNKSKDVLMPLSRHCGLALQTVNVIRGLRKDYERGWVFAPRSYYERVGLTRETLFDPQHEDKALQVVAMLADKADRHLEHGLEYIMRHPRRLHSLRLSLMWPFLFAARTLALSRHNPDVLRSEAKMTRAEIGQIVANTRLFGWSNTWLSAYYRRLSAGPQTGPEATVSPPKPADQLAPAQRSART